jgi:hypothetical protein
MVCCSSRSKNSRPQGHMLLSVFPKPRQATIMLCTSRSKRNMVDDLWIARLAWKKRYLWLMTFCLLIRKNMIVADDVLLRVVSCPSKSNHGHGCGLLCCSSVFFKASRSIGMFVLLPRSKKRHQRRLMCCASCSIKNHLLGCAWFAVLLFSTFQITWQNGSHIRSASSIENIMHGKTLMCCASCSIKNLLLSARTVYCAVPLVNQGRSWVM